MDKITLDCETTGLDFINDKIVGLAHCTSKEDFNYRLIKDLSIDALHAAMNDPDKHFIFHNAKFDLHFLQQLNCPIPKNVHDTSVICHLLNENKSSHLEDAVVRILGVPKWKKELKEYVKKHNCTYADVPQDIMVPYSSKDALYTHLLFEATYPELEKNGMLALYNTEMELTNVLLDMENRGMLIDKEVMQNMSHSLGEQAADLEGQIFKYAGREFNILSDDEVAEILFGDLKLPNFGKSPKSGKYKTDKFTLEKINHPIGPLIIDYRLARKLKSTYCEGAINRIDSNDALHCDLKQIGARTGRYSCADPNLQNIPRGHDIRKGFICRPDYYNFYFDYSQMEYCLFAYFANAEEMKEAFRNKKDLHKTMAQKVHNKENISEEERDKIKTLNFGILYGMGTKSLAQKLKVTKGEAWKTMEMYNVMFPTMKKFSRYLMNKITKEGYVRNPFGRVRRLKPEESYKGVNALIQGTCADILKRAMIKVHKLLKGTKSHLLLCIHDELQVEIHKSELHLVPEIEKCMTDFPQFDVSLNVDVKWTKTNWNDKIKYGE